ncbi:NfeD family protein [Wukongibacter baidiensis]|uniref:NfeD family protein n=1 Tax=Wukongibacter baidiensis TaxID=1723361 RepID=UPI003D7F32A7
MVLSQLVDGLGLLSAIFFGLGLILMIIEIYVPGFGVWGIAGITCFIVGIIVTADTLIEALILMMILLAIIGIIFSILLHSISKGKLPKNMVLSTSMKKEDGYIGTSDMKYFLNRQGRALTILRPVGTVDFDGVKLDVVSEGEFIPKGTMVEVIKVEGRRIVVRRIQEKQNIDV